MKAHYSIRLTISLGNGIRVMPLLGETPNTPSEVTPGEAHLIVMETARRMWGDEYEIVVTTHLNTDNLHNHFIVNSVSFKTGRKFENHISDHHRLAAGDTP